MTNEQLKRRVMYLRKKLEYEHNGGLRAYKLLSVQINFIKAMLRECGGSITIPYGKVDGEIVFLDDNKNNRTTLKLENKNE